MPSILDVRHCPDAVVVVVEAAAAGALSVVAVGFCANATVASSAVPARPAAIDFINIVSSPSAENLCGEKSSINPSSALAAISSRHVRLFLGHSGTFRSALFLADD